MIVASFRHIPPAVSSGVRKVRRVGGVLADQAGRMRAWRYI
jgi:hypothetical protein